MPKPFHHPILIFQYIENRVSEIWYHFDNDCRILRIGISDNFIFRSMARFFLLQNLIQIIIIVLHKLAFSDEHELMRHFEAGSKGTYFDKTLQMNASAFYTVYKNYQIQTFVSVAFVWPGLRPYWKFLRLRLLHHHSVP